MTGRTGTAALVAAVLVSCTPAPASTPAPVPPPQVAVESSGTPAPRLYVTNQDDATITIIDIATRRPVETVDLRALGFGANARPHHAQVEPDGSAWYATLIGAGRVLRFDRDNRITGAVEMEVPGLITLHPTRDLMYVGRSMSAVNPPSRIAVVRRSDMALLEEIDIVFPRPHAIVAHPAGSHVYVASLGVNQIAAVSVEDGTVTLIDIPGAPRGFVQGAVSPDGRWLAMTAELSDELLLFDLSDPAAPRLARTVPMADGPFEPIFTRDGGWIYVTNLAANRVTVVDAETWEVVRVIEHPGFAQPHGIALSPSGRSVFVSNRHQHGGLHDHEGGKPTGSGSVVVICAGSHLVDRVIPAGVYAAGMGAPSSPALAAAERARSSETCR